MYCCCRDCPAAGLQVGCTSCTRDRSPSMSSELAHFLSSSVPRSASLRFFRSSQLRQFEWRAPVCCRLSRSSSQFPFAIAARHFAHAHGDAADATDALDYVGGNDTVYQISTGFGPFNRAVGVAIIRTSGPGVASIFKVLTRTETAPKPRSTTLCKLYKYSNNWRKAGRTVKDMLDSSVLCLYFPSPRSFTGEDVIEYHVHGNPVLVQEILHAIGECNNQLPLNTVGQLYQVRMAEPGEFTKRAFFNGKLDLTQIEGLADLLSAETEQQR